jgi:branched-chain amino acid transport system substrate-binding protein
MPYSGPVSAFGALGKGEVGYFKMINERGGINGRKVNRDFAERRFWTRLCWG